ncbi:MAG: LamG-like jellyroll fold domain-containing protein [Phycisphaerales bacterium JB039]
MIRALAAILAAAPIALAQPESANVGHERHHHPRNPKHDTQAATPQRFVTSRDGAPLALPVEEDAFSFVVFGDRTGGPVEGVSVLADAVRDVNLLEPDFVITVGDLVEGYNERPQWMAQMREFKAIMDNLLCPWFPVAGNHDIYWRGSGERPEGEHEADYEMHFGPLWYAFEHKNCWFIALYSDEGDPVTGEKSINRAASQTMSPEQLAWLTETLGKAADADHIFLFLHHPRWTGGNYGDDWEKVHKVLVEAGNVTAVFGGHIHRMRSDPRDGIEYITLATTGGGQSGTVPSAGWLHHYNIVTVRPEQVALSAIPVGKVMDVREITGELTEQAARLARLRPEVSGPLTLQRDGSVSGELAVRLTNPIERPIDIMIAASSADSRWRFTPDHNHSRIEPMETVEFFVHAARIESPVDGTFRPAELALSMDLLADSARYPIPELVIEAPMDVNLLSPPAPEVEVALDLSGPSGWLQVESADIEIDAASPLTLECWLYANSFGDRTGLVAKTENSDYGFFVNGGRPTFSILLGETYTEVGADEPLLKTGAWHHLAGVYDGKEVRIYLDGALIDRAQRAAPRRTNTLPLMIGADVNGSGQPMSFFDGWIDGVRLSNVARYAGDRFTPARRPGADDRTLLLLNMDGAIGPWAYDESPGRTHPRLRGGATIAPAPR